MTTAAGGHRPCPYCGASGHTEPCPNVEAIDYYENGSIKRIEFRKRYLVTMQEDGSKKIEQATMRVDARMKADAAYRDAIVGLSIEELMSLAKADPQTPGG